MQSPSQWRNRKGNDGVNSTPANARIEELWTTANRLLRSESLSAAEEVATLLAELLKDEPPGRIATFSTPIYGEVVGFMAHVAYLSSDVAKADKLYEHALSELRKSPDTSRVPLGKALTMYALTLIERGRNAEVEAALREALPPLEAAALNQEDGALDLLRVVADRAHIIRAWKIAESALMAVIGASQKIGRPQTELAGYFGSLATVRLNDRRAMDALEPAQESLRLAREGKRPPKDVAAAALTLANVHLFLENYRDALTLTSEATDLAPDDPVVLYNARTLEAKALWADVPQQAIKVLTEAVEIATRTWGEYSKETVRVREDLAKRLSNLNRYREALPHWEFVAAVREYQFGPNSLEYGDVLNSYAIAVDQVGQFARADRLYRKALAIFRRQLGETDDNVLLVRYNLAELARVMGALERSALEFRGLEKTWRSLGKTEAVGFARVLLNFGLTLTSLGEFAEAREKLEGARMIRGKLHGSQSPEYARVLLAIAQLEYASHNYAAAIPLFEQAVAGTRGREEWTNTLETAEFGASCAKIHVERSDAAVERARAQLEKAAERHGPYSPVIVESSRLLALALLGVGRFSQAREILEQVDTGARIGLIEALKSEGEPNLRDAVRPLRDFQTLHLSLLLAGVARDEGAITKAYEMLISLRGAETTILRLRGRSSLQWSSSELQNKIQQLKKAITALELRPRSESSAAHIAADLQAYRDQLQNVESELLDRVGEFRLDMEFLQPALGTLARALSSETALVEFASYHRVDAQLDSPLGGPKQYAAFVVRGGSEHVHLFDLGPASEIDRLIDEFREAVITQPRRKVRDGEVVGWRAPGSVLAQLLIEPIHEAIAGVKKLVVVPEGRIGLVPLGALPTSSGFLMDNLEISYRFASRDVRVISYEEDWGVDGAAAVLGAPDYGLQTGAARSDPLDDEDFLSQFRSGQRFDPLKEAAAECCDIAKLLGIQPLLAQAATEAAVKTLDSPEVLHISTHGFVLERIAPSAVDGQTAAGRALLEDSMERSGLALAGANAFLDGAELPVDAEDGVLYASEVTGMDLMRTDLVTLSACQTGLGDVMSGDGVHGLQRAFTAAGARSVVCSLWEVPDKPTRTLFTRFYEEIFVKKRPRGEALQDVIRELAREYPFNLVAWGGFVLYGDAGVLTRHHPVRRLKFASFVLDSRRPPQMSPAEQVEDRIAEGMRLMNEGDATGALKALDSALQIRLVPAALRARVMYDRAVVLRQSGDLEAALETYDALDEMPDLPERFRALVVIDRATTYLLAENFEEAIETYSIGLAFTGLDFPRRAYALVNRGMAHGQLNHTEEALTDLDTVIDTPGMPRDQRVKAILTKAEMYLQLDRYEDAENELKKVDSFDLTPNEAAGAALLLGQAWAAQGRNDEAIAKLRNVLADEELEDRYRQFASGLLEQFTAKF
jgi:CHAT domain-containing protein